MGGVDFTTDSFVIWKGLALHFSQRQRTFSYVLLRTYVRPHSPTYKSAVQPLKLMNTSANHLQVENIYSHERRSYFAYVTRENLCTEYGQLYILHATGFSLLHRPQFFLLDTRIRHNGYVPKNERFILTPT